MHPLYQSIGGYYCLFVEIFQYGTVISHPADGRGIAQWKILSKMIDKPELPERINRCKFFFLICHAAKLQSICRLPHNSNGAGMLSYTI